jgi:hypothetical protein
MNKRNAAQSFINNTKKITKEDYTHLRNFEAPNTSVEVNISIMTRVLISHQSKQFHESTITYAQPYTKRNV